MVDLNKNEKEMVIQNYIDNNIVFTTFPELLEVNNNKRKFLKFLVRNTGEVLIGSAEIKRKNKGNNYLDAFAFYKQEPLFENIRKITDNLRELLYLIEFNTLNFPRCIACGDYVKMKGKQGSRVYKTCGKKECIEKAHIITNNILYGSDWVPQSEYFIKKSEETSLKNYGVRNVSQSEEIKQKKIETCQQNWGVNNPSQHPEIKAKAQKNIKKTFLKKYNTANIGGVIQTKKILSKSRRKYLYKGILFDSSYELAYYIYCEDYNIPLLRCDFSYPYMSSGTEHFYEPDFILNNQVIEIKGECLEENGVWIPHPASYKEKTPEKVEILKQRYIDKQKCANQHNVKVIYGEEALIYVNYCAKKFGKRNWHQAFKYKKESS